MTARRHLRRMGAAALGALAVGALARAVTLPDAPAAGPAPTLQAASSRPVALPSDDGYRDRYRAAYPVLRAHRFKAVAYLPAGFVNSPASITAEQVLEMDANGIQIGAHSVSHADLVRLSPADLAHEVRD